VGGLLLYYLGTETEAEDNSVSKDPSQNSNSNANQTSKVKSSNVFDSLDKRYELLPQKDLKNLSLDERTELAMEEVYILM